MEYVSLIILIGCGILAAAPLIVKMKPDAQALIEKMVPYQGIGGVILLIWGLISLIRLLIHVKMLLEWVPAWFVFYLAVCLVSIALGFLLGFALLSKYVLSKNEQAAAKGELVRAKLTKIQVPLGVVGIVLGIWCLIYWIIM